MSAVLLDLRGRRHGGAVVDAEAAEAGQLHGRIAQVQAGDEAKELSSTPSTQPSFTPRSPNTDASMPVRLSVSPA